MQRVPVEYDAGDRAVTGGQHRKRLGVVRRGFNRQGDRGATLTEYNQLLNTR